MPNDRQKRLTFRARVASGPIVVAMGAADVLTAKLIESFGFPVVFLSGNLQHKMRGFSDVNVLTMTEMAESAMTISQAIDAPTIADGESGFGLGVNVRRMMRSYEHAGVSAIMLEDSEWPKRPARLGFASPTVDRDIFLDKIKSALDARTDESLVLIARSEVRGDFDEMRERLVRATELGADAFWYATKDPNQMRALQAVMDKPGFGSLPTGLTASEFEARGAKAAIVSNALGIAALAAQRALLTTMRDTGNAESWLKEQPGYADAMAFFDAVGMDDV